MKVISQQPAQQPEAEMVNCSEGGLFPAIHIFTIAYNQQIIETVEMGYGILDHTQNERSDWREYWPIRKYLLNNSLNDDAWYGFFSPRFKEKTNISYPQLIAYIQENGGNKEVCTFSPQVDIGAFFQNVYYGGELMSPGFLDASQRVLDRNNVQVDLGSLYMDSRTTVFSNYIVAKPSYWREWLRIGEMIFEVAESGNDLDSLKLKLNEPTVYPGSVERKVFVIEALASLVLSLNKDLRVHAYDPYKLAWSSQLGQYKEEAVACDALKTAMLENPRSIFKDSFKEISQRILKKAHLIAMDPFMVVKQDFDNVNENLLQIIPKGSRTVVELGCMRGSLARAYLKSNTHTQWIGIDKDADHIEAAKIGCSETHCVDLEDLSTSDFQQFQDAEVWVMSGILERLVNPWGLLEKIRTVIKPEAVIVLSIPNAQHWSVQAQICLGQFRYQDNTAIDKTYLRMFSRKTILEMLTQAGFKIDNGISIIKNPPEETNYIPVLRSLANSLGQNAEEAVQDSQAYEYIMVVSPV